MRELRLCISSQFLSTRDRGGGVEGGGGVCVIAGLLCRVLLLDSATVMTIPVMVRVRVAVRRRSMTTCNSRIHRTRTNRNDTLIRRAHSASDFFRRTRTTLYLLERASEESSLSYTTADTNCQRDVCIT